jgi:hypothetical protein
MANELPAIFLIYANSALCFVAEAGANARRARNGNGRRGVYREATTVPDNNMKYGAVLPTSALSLAAT